MLQARPHSPDLLASYPRAELDFFIFPHFEAFLIRLEFQGLGWLHFSECSCRVWMLIGTVPVAMFLQ